MSIEFTELVNDELYDYNGGGLGIYIAVIGLIAALSGMSYSVSKDVAYNKTWSNHLNNNSPVPTPCPTPTPPPR